MPESNDKCLSAAIREMLSSQVQCVLATVSKKAPTLHLMAYAFSEDLKHLYCLSLSNTRKVNNIKNNSAVSLLWDNRTGNTSDHIQGTCLSADAKARIFETEKNSGQITKLLERNPELSSMLNDDSCVIIKIRINNFILVQGYSKISRYSP